MLCEEPSKTTFSRNSSAGIRSSTRPLLPSGLSVTLLPTVHAGCQRSTHSASAGITCRKPERVLSRRSPSPSPTASSTSAPVGLVFTMQSASSFFGRTKGRSAGRRLCPAPVLLLGHRDVLLRGDCKAASCPSAVGKPRQGQLCTPQSTLTDAPSTQSDKRLVPHPTGNVLLHP